MRSLVEECIEESMPIWEQCLQSEFLQKLGKGTLEEECFFGYLVDDSLYLREYAKVFALGMLKAKTMEEIRVYYSFLFFVQENEEESRLYYLKKYGIKEEEIQNLPLRSQNRKYVDTMLQAAQEGEGVAECMMAVLPCMLSYRWIFRTLQKQYPNVVDTVYQRLIEDYTGEEYNSICEEWITYTEKFCVGLTEERKRRCKEIFMHCSKHEQQFWEMSCRPRTDQ